MGVKHRCCEGLLVCLVSLLLFACSGSDHSSVSNDQPGGPEPLSLRRFADCTELQNYLGESSAQEAVLKERFTPTPVTTGEVGLDFVTDSAAGASSVAREFTQTNTQESGVDEADFAKSDGDYLYLVSGGSLLIYDAWPAAQMSEQAHVELEGNPFALFIEQDKALVLSRIWDYSGIDALFTPQSWQVVKLSVFDIGDRTRPYLLRDIYFEGGYVDARLTGGHLHLVISSGVTTYGLFPLVNPLTDPFNEARNGSYQPEVRFPRIFDQVYGGDGVEQQVVEICACENVYRPETGNGNGLLTLFTLDLAAPQAETRSLSILGDSGLVYASTESLVVAAQNNNSWFWLPAAEDDSDGPQATTFLHKFSLGAEPAYVSSGKVSGWVQNQFSLSEYEGVLRVATTEPA